MNKNKFISLAISVSMILGTVPIVSAAAGTTTVILNPADASPFNGGRFDGWGTSLCWWANRVGGSEKLTKAAADAFFSEEGLSLDIARYNLGGGDDPEHNHINRSDSKVPGVWSKFTLSADGKDVETIEYDLNKDKNQLNMAKAALAANPDLYFEGFSNSAPYFMTVSGCSSGGVALNEDGSIKLDENGEMTPDGNTDNLKADMYDDFGSFIADATALFKEEGIEFKSYSPMNEPDTNYWSLNSPKQEGCHFTPGESQSKAIVETRKALDAKGLQNVIVAGMDETSIDKSVSNLDKLTSEAKKALGRIDTHTYDGSKRAQLKAKAFQFGKTLWMSEVDKGGDGATLANMIITDMNGMQPSAWVMWDIIDVHKDSEFVDPTTGNKTEANNSKNYTDGLWGVGVANHDDETLFLTNKYYAFGQFTKYINPGDTIIASSSNTLAAYNKYTGDIKIVANNAGNASDLNYEFNVSAFDYVGKTVKEIRSDMAGNEKWKEITGETTLENKILKTTLKANTITTYVIKGYRGFGSSGKAMVTEFEPIDGGVIYNYEVDESLKDYDKYFAVYDNNGVLRQVTKDDNDGIFTGDFADCSFKLFVWDGMDIKIEPEVYNLDAVVKYAVINGGGNELKRGSETQLSIETNIKNSDVVWSVDNPEIASISQTGLLTVNGYGDVTVTAKVDRVQSQRTFTVNMYTVSGTPSWGDAKTLPSDNADYLKAVDGNLDTYFDGTTNGYVMYDYGESVKINSVKLAARSGNGMPERTKGAKIQGSNDGIAWTDLYTLSNAISAGSYTTVTASQMTDNHAYRYFRYTNSDNMANIAEFIIDASPSTDVASGEPVVTDIEEFTDNFEGNTNIFGAQEGDLSTDENQVFATSLARYNKVFVPVRSTAKSDIANAITLSATDKFRMKFNVFSGWESNGQENEFSIKDSSGNELIGFKITGGGYNLNQMRIGGTDLLASAAEKPVFQCITSATKGANRWGHATQPYINNMGANKTVEIIIDGAGNVSVEMNGGANDLSYTGTVTAPVNIKTLELKGDYNSASDSVVSYDNFDADLISYN